MGFLNNIFGESQNEKQQQNFDWIDLNSLADINDIILNSSENTILIFKHSTRCSVSRMALKQFENEFNRAKNIQCYLLDLLNHRDISSTLSSRFAVVHQSPQVLVIRNGICIFNISHSDIDAAKLFEII